LGATRGKGLIKNCGGVVSRLFDQLELVLLENNKELIWWTRFHFWIKIKKILAQNAKIIKTIMRWRRYM
jgi:hypothetical protein